MNKLYLFCLTASFTVYWPAAEAQSVPVAGELVITEIMVNPESVSDANGEWFEIRNVSGRDLLLNGLVIKDAGSNEHVITSTGNVVIPTGGYFVLAKNGDELTNGGFKAGYVYQNFTLGNTADQVIITGPGGTLIDQVSYQSTWPMFSGASMELNPGKSDAVSNDDPASWNPARSPFGAGDKGSPGMANGGSSGVPDRKPAVFMQAFPNPSKERLTVRLEFDRPRTGEILLINLAGQVVDRVEFRNETDFCRSVGTGKLAPGIWFIRAESGSWSEVRKVFADR